MQAQKNPQYMGRHWPGGPCKPWERSEEKQKNVTSLQTHARDYCRPLYISQLNGFMIS